MAEHPATPDPSFASTWRSAIIQLLLKHPSCKLERVQQYRWGCTVRKPTGLLHFNIPRFVETIYKHSLKDAQPPDDVAIGMQNGQFLTSSHKEYPPVFGKALAWALGDGVALNFKNRGCASRTRFASWFFTVVGGSGWCFLYGGWRTHLPAGLPGPMSPLVSRAFPLR